MRRLTLEEARRHAFFDGVDWTALRANAASARPAALRVPAPDLTPAPHCPPAFGTATFAEDLTAEPALSDALGLAEARHAFGEAPAPADGVCEPVHVDAAFLEFFEGQRKVSK